MNGDEGVSDEWVRAQLLGWMAGVYAPQEYDRITRWPTLSFSTGDSAGRVIWRRGERLFIYELSTERFIVSRAVSEVELRDARFNPIEYARHQCEMALARV